MTRIGCPVLAFYGTRGDVAPTRTSRSSEQPRPVCRFEGARFETRLIDGADHMYTGEEDQVARVISEWATREFSGTN